MIDQTAFVGVAGWRLPVALAPEFPAGPSHLQRYAQRLNAVEINSSFYRPHALKTYRRWAASTPPGFRFSVKAPKAMTHQQRLADCQDGIDRFGAQVAGLEDKLGVVLVQLPPSLGFDRALAARFFEQLKQRICAPVACEPRHAGWFAADAQVLLTDMGIAQVAADPAPMGGWPAPGGCQKLVYYRMHGSPRVYRSAYDAPALRRLGQDLDRHLKAGAQVWCIFDNTAEDAALVNALELRDAGPAA